MKTQELTAEFAFKLYDTYGFPLDLTELMAREAGLSVDTAGFDALMEQQRERARSSQKKETISVSSITSDAYTEFVGFDELTATATVLEVIEGNKPRRHCAGSVTVLCRNGWSSRRHRHDCCRRPGHGLSLAHKKLVMLFCIL